MTSPQMSDTRRHAEAARLGHELPDAPLAMPEQDLRPARKQPQSKASLGWFGQILRGLRVTSAAQQGTARS